MAEKQTRFDSVLIANRGEIACRIMRTAKAMGLRTIAVYSDADAEAPHVRIADDAVRIGPAPVSESYLKVDAIIDAAKTIGAGAIHPGYGFLSENATFADACETAGLTFIGPPADAIDLMGDKAKAKRRMIAAGVPCVPGYQGEDQSDAALIAQTKAIGFPIMVKAAAGGGGRGMRLVENADALADAIETARSEAENAFGSGDLILERAIVEPRHVEIQIFADARGNVIHLGERDCSVQRRHQKVLEEAPSPAMTPELRRAMGEAAVNAARDINYVSAGTVEFLLDRSGEFYFLEMNTRLQVEHPVTEMVTGLDLVAMQIRVAQGEPLGVSQDDIALTGHAIEARLYAEDVGAGFLPATGPIDLWRPAGGDSVRIDAGIETGGGVSPFYDPMIAKVIAHGSTRDEARRRLVDALKRTALFGVTSNKKFLIDALERPSFAEGAATTAFIAETFTEADLATPSLTTGDAIAAALLLFCRSRKAALENATAVTPALVNWASATRISTPYRFADGDTQFDLSITPIDGDRYSVAIGDQLYDAAVESIEDHDAMLTVNGARQSVLFNFPDGDSASARIQFSIGGRDFDVVNLNAAHGAAAADGAGAGAVTAPMHGLLVDVFVKPGDAVSKGDRLAVLEAMKMQHELTADIDGEMAAVHFEPGVQVAADALLMEIADAKG